MESTFLQQIGDGIDNSFFFIGLAILAIEIVGGLINNTLRWRGAADMLVNISTQIPFLLVEIFILSFAYALYTYVETEYIAWTFTLNWASLIAAVLIADFLYYWEHRLAHEVRCLWIHHAVHHSSRYMNITTGVRFGPFEGVWSMLVMFPMLLAGFPAELIIFGNLVVLAYQTWLHTELIGKLGPLEQVLNTPSHHRVHHGCDDEYLDKNYGGILIIWDRLFGTFQEERQRPKYGLNREFDSVNPVMVWFSELPRFFRDVFNARSFRELMHRLFDRPEWQPADKLPNNPTSQST